VMRSGETTTHDGSSGGDGPRQTPTG